MSVVKVEMRSRIPSAFAVLRRQLGRERRQPEHGAACGRARCRPRRSRVCAPLTSSVVPFFALMTYARSPETRKVASSGFSRERLHERMELAARSRPGRGRRSPRPPSARSGRAMRAGRGRACRCSPSPWSLSLTGAAAIVRAVVAARSAASVEIGGSTVCSCDVEGRQARERRGSRSEARTASSSIAVPSRPGTTTALLPFHRHAGGDRALGERRRARPRARRDRTRGRGAPARRPGARRTGPQARRAGRRWSRARSRRRPARSPRRRRWKMLDGVTRMRLACRPRSRPARPAARRLCVDARPRVGRRKAADVDSGDRDARAEPSRGACTRAREAQPRRPRSPAPPRGTPCSVSRDAEWGAQGVRRSRSWASETSGKRGVSSARNAARESFTGTALGKRAPTGRAARRACEAEHGHELALEAARRAIAAARERVSAGEQPEDLVADALERPAGHGRAAAAPRPQRDRSRRPHESRPRAARGPRARAHPGGRARLLEPRVRPRGRQRAGSRQDHVAPLLRDLTGAEAALVVNNNAAAVLLAVAALAEGRDVRRLARRARRDRRRLPHSRRARALGRPPRRGRHDEPHAARGLRARDRRAHRPSCSACTSRTSASSASRRARGSKTSRASRRIAALVLVDDLGSGVLPDVGDEPTVRESLAAGAHLVTFSGDKLLGGPAGGDRRRPGRPRRARCAATRCSGPSAPTS